MEPAGTSAASASTFNVPGEIAEGAVGFSDDIESPHAAAKTAAATTSIHFIRVCMTSPGEPCWGLRAHRGAELQAIFHRFDGPKTAPSKLRVSEWTNSLTISHARCVVQACVAMGRDDAGARDDATRAPAVLVG